MNSFIDNCAIVGPLCLAKGMWNFYLGLSVVALGLVIWLVVLLVRDPQGKVRAALKRN